VTHRSASYHALIRRAPATASLFLAALALTACGSQRSTLPPAPARGGAVSLADLARYPEVYADAQITTVGTIATTSDHGAALLVLRGAPGARIVLEPAAAAARLVGRRVRVSGVLTVSFKLGYEILIARIAPAATLSG